MNLYRVGNTPHVVSSCLYRGSARYGHRSSPSGSALPDITATPGPKPHSFVPLVYLCTYMRREFLLGNKCRVAASWKRGRVSPGSPITRFIEFWLRSRDSFVAVQARALIGNLDNRIYMGIDRYLTRSTRSQSLDGIRWPRYADILAIAGVSRGNESMRVPFRSNQANATLKKNVDFYKISYNIYPQ